MSKNSDRIYIYLGKNDQDIKKYLQHQTLKKSLLFKLSLRLMMNIYGSDTDFIQAIIKDNSSIANHLNEDTEKASSKTLKKEIKPKSSKRSDSSKPAQKKKKKERKALPKESFNMWDDQNYDNL